MDYVLDLIAASMLFVAGLTGAVSDTRVTEPASKTVEVGLYETSPRGEEGGFATPASGCSPASPSWHGYPIHDCSTLPEIHVSRPVVRYDEPVTITWNPYTHQNCVLSQSVMVLPPANPSADVSGSRVDTPIAETTYSITCDGVGNSDSDTVRVLPLAQET